MVPDAVCRSALDILSSCAHQSVCACSQLVTTSFDGSVVRWEPSRQGGDDEERGVGGTSTSGVRRRRRLQMPDTDMYDDDF